MNKRNHPPQPDKVRRLPEQFSWVDQRLVRDRHMARGSADSWMLYLFLVTVSDAKGISYYSDQTLCRTLAWEQLRLTNARRELCMAQLAAYKHPVYQVLALDEQGASPAYPIASSPNISSNSVARGARCGSLRD